MLACNGTDYPVYKVYYVYGIGSTFLTLLTLLGNSIILSFYKPKFQTRYAVIIFGLAISDFMIGLAHLIQIVALSWISTCSRQEAILQFAVENISYFSHTKFEEIVILAIQLFDIFLAVSTGYTLYMVVVWLSQHLDTGVQCCCSTAIIIGYPVLLSALKFRSPYLYRNMLQPSISIFLQHVLPLFIPTLILLLLLLIINLRNITRSRDRHVTRRTVDLVSKVTIAANFVYLAFRLAFFIAMDRSSHFFSEQVHLFFAFICLKMVPLTAATVKVSLLFLGEVRFWDNFRSYLSRTRFKGILLSKGVYMNG